MTTDRKSARVKRAKRTRRHIRELGVPVLSVHRTPRHIYAQVIEAGGRRTVASASTVEKNMRESIAYGGNCTAAEAIGRIVAERTIQAGVSKVAFDRSGFKYHGRVKALAEAARDAGLEF